jgi:uncharacterized protein
MRRIRGVAAAITAVLLSVVFTAHTALADAPIPKLERAVTDLSGTLRPDQSAALEGKLQSFAASHGSQIAVLIVPTTQPETIEQYGIRAVEKWKLGRSKFDDGVLLLIAKGDRRVRIEVGRGLEGAVPDTIASRIVREIITPRFKAGDFYGGIDAGIDALQGGILGERLPAPSPGESEPRGPDFETLLFLGIFAGFFFQHLFGHIPGAAATSALGFLGGYFLLGVLQGAGLMAILFVILSLQGVRSGLRYSGWGGGFGPGGGFGGGFGSAGGGFSGGGGSFSGGGASGSW